jgi:hypothetical protein
MNITGRLMLMLSRRRLTCGRCLGLYIDAVSAAVAQQLRIGQVQEPAAVEAIIDEQVALLEQSLRGRVPAPSAGAAPEGAGGAVAEAPMPDDAHAADTATDASEPRRRQARLPRG